MAQFEVGDMDDIIAEIDKMGSDVPKIMKEMVEAGGKIALDAVKLNTPSRSGDLRASMYRTGGHCDSNGNWYDNIHADGYDRNGKPNPLKANVLEGGKTENGRVKARHFMKNAINSSKGAVETAMRKVFEARTGVKDDN